MTRALSGPVHPAAPGLALLLSCALVNVLDGGVRVAVAVAGLLLSAWLVWRAFGPERFFRDPA